MRGHFLRPFTMLHTINKRFPAAARYCVIESFLGVVSTYLPLFVFAAFLDAVLSSDIKRFLLFGSAYFIVSYCMEILLGYIREKRIVCARIISEESINALYNKIEQLSYEKYASSDIKEKCRSALENMYYEFDYSNVIEEEANILRNVFTVVMSVLMALFLLTSLPVLDNVYGKIASPLACTLSFIVLTSVLVAFNVARFRKKAPVLDELIKSHAAVENKIMYLQNNIIFKFKNYLSYALFDMRSMLTHRFEEDRRENLSYFTKTRVIDLYLSNGYTITSWICTVYVYALTVFKVLAGAIPVSLFVTVTQGMLKVYEALFAISSSYGKIKRAIPYFDNVEYVLQLPNEEGTQTCCSITEPYVIQYEHVYYRYPNATSYAVEDLNFTMESSKKHVIVGENGSGKSTMLLLLLRYITPSSGRILINGVDIKTIDPHAYRALFSCMFQASELYPIPLVENICFSKEYRYDAVHQALHQSGASQDFFDDGLLLDRSCEREFSGGEAQKVIAARAFYHTSKICIFDEPSSALDALSEDKMYREIRSLSNDLFVIFVSHRMSSCRLCDDIIVLRNGKLLERGNHSQLMSQQKEYYDLWMAQAETYHDSSSGGLS